MDNKLLVLKLYLDNLGVPLKIESVEDRKLVQKAVYLGQLSGIDLGYRYGWYKLGPYCASLTDDYYDLDRALAVNPSEADGKQFSDAVQSKLKVIKPLLNPQCQLPADQWLELLASYHYLREIRRKPHEEAKKVLALEKPQIANYADRAKELLEKFKLLTKDAIP